MPVSTNSDWCIAVYGPSGGNLKSLYSNRPLVSYVRTKLDGTLERISENATLTALESIRIFRNVDGFCDSVEITADAYNARLEIEPFDIVSIQFPDLDATTGDERDDAFMVPVARGFATISRSRMRTGQTNVYRILGSSHDLAYCDTGNVEMSEGLDVANYVNVLRANKGIKLHQSIKVAGNFPPVGVLVTRRVNSNNVDLAQFLASLKGYAEQGGVKVRYGVDDYGLLRFEKAPLTALYDKEQHIYDSRQGEVVFREPSNAEHINAVRWLVGMGSTDAGLFLQGSRYSAATPDPITHLSKAQHTTLGIRTTHLAPSHDVIVQIPANTNVFRGSPVASFVGETQDETFNVNRITDGDSSSYIVMQGARRSDKPTNQYYVTLRCWFPNGLAVDSIAALSFSFKQDPSSPEPTHATAYVRPDIQGDANINFGRIFGTTFDFLTEGFKTTRETNPEVRATGGDVNASGILFFGDRARARKIGVPAVLKSTDFIDMIFGFQSDAGPVRVAIQDFRLHRIDTQILNGLAIEAYQFPTKDPFDLTYFYHKPYYRSVALAALEGDDIPLTEATSVLALDQYGKTTTFTTGVPVSSWKAAEQAAQDEKVRTLMNNATRSTLFNSK